MQNVCVNNLNTIPKIGLKGVSNLQTRPFSPLKKDTFERTTQKKEISFEGWPKIFQEVNGVCNSKLAKLSKSEIEHLTKLAKSSLDKNLPNDVTKFSQILKRGLDAKFDKKYVFVSIGQSPAVLAEALSTMGIETAICPISNLTNLSNASSILRNPNLSKYFDYLKKMGLNPEKVKTSGKKYIFVDYSSTGKSLKIFEEFMRNKKTGYDLPNVKFVSIQDLLEACKPSNNNESQFMLNFLNKYIHKTELKEFSPIFKLPVGDIHRVQEFRDNTPANEKFNMLKFLVYRNVRG